LVADPGARADRPANGSLRPSVLSGWPLDAGRWADTGTVTGSADKSGALSMIDRGGYLLGMEPDEVRRLKRQHAAWRRLTNRAWDWARFGPGQTLVDLGSGPGFTSVELAKVVGPSGRVIAVDSSRAATDKLRALVDQKRLDNVEIITADVMDFDPSPWSPDGLFARWLFCFLRDPDAVVRHLASALRPGATVAVMDYYNYVAIRTEPNSPLFTKVFRAVYESFAHAGGSLDVAGRLPALLDAVGVRVSQIEPLCQVDRPGSPIWNWLADFQNLYLPTLVQKGYLTAMECDEYEAWWREQEERNDSLLFAPPLLCVIGVKE
jgi:ubiquinone/menaquinone biosynthesis C-methylase UbiE